MGSLTGYERRQRAVYWMRVAETTNNRPIVSAGIELRVRWVDKEDESLSADGTPLQTDVRVISDRELVIGSVLWLGKLRDLPSPFFNQTLYQVVLTRSVPDVANESTRYTAFLIRYGQTLPTIR